MVYKYSAKDFLKKVANLLKGYRKEMILAITLTIISAALSIYAPKLLGRIIQVLYDYRTNIEAFPLSSLLDDLTIIALLYTLAYLIKIPANMILSRISEKVVSNVRNALYDKLNHIILNDSVYTGNVMSRMNNDVANIKTFLSSTLNLYLSNTLMTVFILLMSLEMDYRLALVFVGILPLYTVLMYYVHSRTNEDFRIHQEDLGEMIGYIGDSLQNRVMIKTYEKEDYLKEKFNEYNIRQKNSYFKSRYYSEVLNPLNSFMTSLIQLVLYLYGGLLLYDGIISVGTLTIFILYVQIFKKNLNSLNGIINSIKVTYASLDRILEILDKKDNTRKEYHINNGDVTGRIEFRNVSYNNIRNLNLIIEAGEKVNVTGADREDLVDILLGFRECEEGCILIDDINIREYKITPPSDVFGLTTQNDYIFDGTIEDNIKCENNTITSDEVIRVSERIGLHEKVLEYPDKYDTIISDDRKNFSHVEKKLICLARAIISNPQIIILDNPYYISRETLNYITDDRTAIILTAENDGNTRTTIRI